MSVSTTVKVSKTTSMMIKKVAAELGGVSADQAINQLLQEHMVAQMDRWRAESQVEWEQDMRHEAQSTSHTIADGLSDEPWDMTGWEDLYEESLR